MQSKSLLIAIAAFAVTATGVHAYAGNRVFEKAGLNENQISAFTTARELKEAGDYQAAREVLLQAGIDEEVLKSVRQASKEAREHMRAALMSGDYRAFKVAIAGTPLAEAVTSEADFERLQQAHELIDSGKWEAAKGILNELGIDPKHRLSGLHRGMKMHEGLKDLTSVQQEALAVARQANDKAAVREILNEAGIALSPHHRNHR